MEQEGGLSLTSVVTDSGHELVNFPTVEAGVEQQPHDGGGVARLVVEEVLGQVEREREQGEQALAEAEELLADLSADHERSE